MASSNLIATAGYEAQSLFELSQSLGNSLRLDEMISIMASRLRQLIPYDTFALYLKQQDVLTLKYIEGENKKSFSTEAIPEGKGISGWVAQSGKAILNGNAAVETSYHNNSGPSGELRSALSVPIFDMQTQVFGVLTLYSSTRDFFQRDHLRILQAMEGKLSLSLQNAMHLQRSEYDAETDFLTTLPNARGLFLHLETQLRHCKDSVQPMAVVVCDLNAFKEVNDRCGHLTGNLLLGMVADGFRALCLPGERVARMGGDEFVFLIPGLTGERATARLRAIAETVVSACRRCPGVSVPVTACLGTSFFPADGDTAEALLAVAEHRMLLDKQLHHQWAKEHHGLLVMKAFAV